MQRKSGLLTATLTLLTCALLTPVHAGWVATESNGSVWYVSKGMMKSDEDNGSVIFKATDGTITMINDEKRMYTESTAEEFCEFAGTMIDKMMEHVPPEQREAMKEMMGFKEGAAAPKVNITKAGDGGKVAGFSTEKYLVEVDGELYEEVWLTTDEAVLKDLKPLIKMISDFLSCNLSAAAMGGTPPEATEEYLKMWESGLVLKVVKHDDSSPRANTDVKSLVQSDVPDSTFEVPKGYRKADFTEFLGLQ